MGTLDRCSQKVEASENMNPKLVPEDTSKFPISWLKAKLGHVLWHYFRTQVYNWLAGSSVETSFCVCSIGTNDGTSDLSLCVLGVSLFWTPICFCGHHMWLQLANFDKTTKQCYHVLVSDLKCAGYNRCKALISTQWRAWASQSPTSSRFSPRPFPCPSHPSSSLGHARRHPGSSNLASLHYVFTTTPLSLL